MAGCLDCVAARSAGRRQCARCHAAYMRDWRKTQSTLHVLKVRRSIASVFESLGTRVMNGFTAAAIIRDYLK